MNLTPDDRAEIASRIRKLQVRFSGSDGGHSVIECLKGRQAYLNNVPLAANPNIQINLRDSWERGWIAEEAETRKRKAEREMWDAGDRLIESMARDLSGGRSWRWIALTLASLVTIALRLTVFSQFPPLSIVGLLITIGIVAILFPIALKVSREDPR